MPSAHSGACRKYKSKGSTATTTVSIPYTIRTTACKRMLAASSILNGHLATDTTRNSHSTKATIKRSDGCADPTPITGLSGIVGRIIVAVVVKVDATIHDAVGGHTGTPRTLRMVQSMSQ